MKEKNIIRPSEAPKMDPEVAETRIKAMRDQIGYYKEEIELQKEALAIQMTNPKLLQPNFAFEQTEAWEECLKKQWQFNHKKTIDNLTFSIEETTKRILEMEASL